MWLASDYGVFLSFKYPVLFVLVSSACFGVTLLASHLVKIILFRELILSRQRCNGRIRDLRKILIYGCLGSAFLGLFVSVCLTGRLVFGLGTIFLFPLIVSLIFKYLKLSKREVLDQSALTFFHGLQGLIKVGVSFPTALFHLSESVPCAFSQELKMYLGRFEQGKTLESVLSRFRTNSQLKRTSVCLLIVEMAYRNGLAVAPLLDRMLPILEAEQQNAQREKSLRRSAFVQLVFAMAMPWILAITLQFFQPTVLGHFTASSFFAPTLAVALVFQILGGFAIWRVSRFC